MLDKKIEGYVEDLFAEHEMHSSDEWKTLQNKCSECYGACKRWGNMISPRIAEDKSEFALGRLDYSIDKNPLE
jgi:hypothetical protein